MKRILCFLILLVTSQFAALAQQCPGASHMVVGLAAGGGMDALARLISQRYTERFGQTMIVDNKVGANGNIAAQAVARAPRDGCTLILIGDSHNRNTVVYANAGYEPRNFDPVILAVSGPPVLLAHAGQPFKTIAELVEYAKARPGKLSYGSSGIGSTQHVAMDLFFREAGIEIAHVPYKGASQSIADAAAGVVPLAAGSISAALPFIASGKVVALAVTGPTRWPSLPDVPTLVEAGYPGAVTTSWMGLVVPSGTPLPVREKLNREFRTILEEPGVRDRLLMQGFATAGGSVDDFGRFLEQDNVLMRKLMLELKVKVD